MTDQKYDGFWPKWQENKLFASLLIIIFICGIVWLGGQIRNDNKEYRFVGKAPVRDILTVDGTGKVVGVPDVAVVDAGILTEGKEVIKVQTENTNKMNNLIAKLKGFGVDSKDLQTTSYSIYPQYEWPDGRQVMRGYQVSQNVRVKIRDLGKIGAILGAVGEAGANQVSGVTFQIDDPEQLRSQAREKALTNAYQKASFLSKKAGIKLGKVVSYNEDNGGIQPYYSYAKEMGIGGGVAAPVPSVESGSLDVSVNVNVSYEIL